MCHCVHCDQVYFKSLRFSDSLVTGIPTESSSSTVTINTETSNKISCININYQHACITAIINKTILLILLKTRKALEIPQRFHFNGQGRQSSNIPKYPVLRRIPTIFYCTWANNRSNSRRILSRNRAIVFQASASRKRETLP